MKPAREGSNRRVPSFHPESVRLGRALAGCLALAEPRRLTVYRATAIAYANRRDLLSGEGARRFGARWTPLGAFAAVYGGLDPQTALLEALGTGARYGFDIDQRMPLVLVAVDANLERLLDLTLPAVRSRLRLSIERMIEEDWEACQAKGAEARTQAVARLARDVGIQGLVVPSARFRSAKNLVAFPDRLSPGGLEIQNLERLPEPRS